MSQQEIDEAYKKWEEIKDKGTDDEIFEWAKSVAKNSGVILFQKPNFLFSSNEFKCYHIYLHYSNEIVEIVACPQGTEVKINKKENQIKRNYYRKNYNTNYYKKEH